MAVKKAYWDTTCFISYLSGSHPNEVSRAVICEDVLQHARSGGIEIWTSVWTIVETIRPKAIYKPTPLPPWTELLTAPDKLGALQFPRALGHFEQVWEYYNRNTLVTRPLAEADVKLIKGMFDWPWIRLVQVLPSIAQRATEIARAHNMKPADSLHVASALSRGCEVLHRWDRDYTRTDTLICSQEPERISPQGLVLAPGN
jgi:predicted nucleic acid-binding protein